MSVVSFEFLALVLAVVLVYQLCPGRFRWIILLCGSLVFVAWSQSLVMSVVMTGQILLTWLCSLWIQSSSDKEKTGRTRGLLLFGILSNLLVLLVLKDSGFFLGDPLKIDAPVGVSYYTLILMGYLLEVYWGLSKPQRNLGKMTLFSVYFPMMTSGPITRYTEIQETLYSGKRITYESLTFGLQRILWGLFKKLVIASRLGIYVDAVYGDWETYGGWYLLVAFPAFVFQLYTDFSGGIDIIMGISELFGVVLPENFQTPFFSTSISEFWRRWHITIGTWLKDFVMYPLLKSSVMQKLGKWSRKTMGKKRGKKIPTFAALLVTWFLIGFWHGGAWNFIWGSGLYYGILIILSQIMEPVFKGVIKGLHIQTDCFSWKCFQRIRTFLVFTVGLSFFRSYDGLMMGFARWKQALTIHNPEILTNGALLQLGLDGWDWTVIGISLLILLAVGIVKQKGSVREQLAKQNLPFRWILLLLLIFIVLILGMYGSQYDAASFIYEQF